MGVYVDLKKAFETVNHNILIYELFNYGIKGAALHWFDSSLSDRKQYIQFGTFKSQHAAANISVWQGLVLGPTLCFCCIAITLVWLTIIQTVILCYVLMTLTFLNGKDLNNLKQYIEGVINTQCHWFEDSR